MFWAIIRWLAKFDEARRTAKRFQNDPVGYGRYRLLRFLVDILFALFFK